MIEEEYDRNKFLTEVASYEEWKREQDDDEDSDIYFADVDWDES